MKELLKLMSSYLAAAVGLLFLGTAHAGPGEVPLFKDGFEGESVTLSGVVRDAPIPFATVTVTVGGKTFTTVADANGNFVIEIAGIDLSSLVLIESTGINPTDETKTVDMASIAGTLAKLIEDADGDGIVDGTENPNINNTPYTTALFVLMGEANGGETPDTLEELQDAERSVDASELLELAAVIKLIVDGGSELPIDPSTGQPYETIISFLADAEVDVDGDTPVDNFIAANEAEIEAAITEILADNEIVPAFTTEGIPDRYYFLEPAQTGFLSRNGSAYSFEKVPAQTGEIRAVSSSGSGRVIAGDYDWQVNVGKLIVDWTVKPTETFALFNDPFSPAALTQRCQAPDDPQFESCLLTCQDYINAWDFAIASPGFPEKSFWITRRIALSELTRYAVGAAGTREFASQTQTIEVEIRDLTVDYDLDGPNPPVNFEFCPEFELETINVELLDAGKNPPKTLAIGDFTGDTLALPIIYDPDDAEPNFLSNLFLDFVTLNNDPDQDGWRSTSTLLSGVTPDWRIVDGNELQFDYGGGVVQTLQQLEPTLDLETAFWMEVNGVPQPFGLYDMTLRVDPGFQQFTEAELLNAAGEYWSPVTNNAWRKRLWQKNGSGQNELVPGAANFGWEFAAINDVPPGYNLGADEAFDLLSWNILATPTSAGNGQLNLLPAGTVRIGSPFAGRIRFWIPIAKTMVSVPDNVNHAPTPRQRLYMIEHEYRSDGSMRIAPRINAQEIFYKTIFSWYVPPP